MNTSALQNILLKNSTSKYYIQYEGYLVNHMSHGIVALSRLGATVDRIQKFIDWYRPRLEDANNFQDVTQNLNNDELLGTRRCYYTLVDDYKQELEKNGGCMEKLIEDRLPRLLPGLIGSALHGTIHLGYGFAGRSPQVVCEGLAYMHFSYLPLKSTKDKQILSTEDIGKGPLSILEVIEKVRMDTELVKSMIVKSQSKEYLQMPIGDFSRKAKSLFDYHGDDILRYVSFIQIPLIDKMETLDTEMQCKALLRWILDSAIVVYTFAEKVDFFLLHGVTAAWSLLQVGPVAIGKSTELTRELVKTYLCALLATYITQETPVLHVESLEDDITEKHTWPSIVEKALAEDLDEHAFKLIQVCHELSQDTEDQNLQKIYVKAALRTLGEPFSF